MQSLEQNKSNIIINNEFQSMIRPLSPTEYSQLEEDILKNGCQSPIIIWGSKNILLDGHNRYEICLKHNIKFQTTTIEFLNNEEAKRWVVKNQLGRRNLTYYERASLVLQLEYLIKDEARKNQLATLKQSTVSQNSDKREKQLKIHTDKYLAKISGVSHDTIAKVRKIENCADDEMKMKLIKNKLSINAAYNEIQKREKNNSSEISKKEKGKSNKVNSTAPKSNSLITIPQKARTHLNMGTFSGKPYMFSTEDKLADSFVLMKKMGLKYKHCIVCDRGDDTSPIFFIEVSEATKYIRDETQVFPVYKKQSYNKSNRPDYYNELIQVMLSDKELIKELNIE